MSSAAGVQQAIGDASDYLAVNPRGSDGWARYRLGLALEEMFAIESLAYDLIGIYDDKTSDMPRVESCIAKLYGTDGLHRNLHYLEPLYGIEGQTQRFRIEKDRRDARVMTIYEGTNEIQQFLLLKDSIDMIGPKLEKRQSVLARLVDIGAELFAMAATISRATALAQKDEAGDGPLAAADVFCRQSRRRIKDLFRSVFSNDDAAVYSFAQSVLEGEQLWLEHELPPTGL